MSENEAVIRKFISAWSKLDPDALVEFFTPDGVYHNMPMQPVAGRENLRAFIAGFLKGWTSTEWEILTLVSQGDVVFAERIDRTRVGAKAVALPCCGVFEMQGGKIKVWRDYFDLNTYGTALAG